jgi:hypothetical protein
VSRPRFLVDHDFNEKIVRGALRREPTMEFRLAREVGLEQAPDRQILEYAAQEAWLVLSHDLNTMTAIAYEMVSTDRPMRGLLLAKQRASVARVIDSLVLVWAASEAEEYVNQIRYLPL